MLLRLLISLSLSLSQSLSITLSLSLSLSLSVSLSLSLYLSLSLSLSHSLSLPLSISISISLSLSISFSPHFSSQVPEGLALWKLLQLPGSGPLGILYRFSQAVKGLVTKILSLLPSNILNFIPVGLKNRLLPTQISLSTTLIPFTEIVRMVRTYCIC